MKTQFYTKKIWGIHAITTPTLLLSSCVSDGNTQINEAIRPNILYIIVDDMGYGDVNFDNSSIGAFNNNLIKTPNLAQLASEGIVLTHHYASSPVSSPSRAGLMTGRNPTRLNINRWIDDGKFDGSEYLHADEVTIAEKCREAGYETSIFGKWHLNCADWRDQSLWQATDGTFPNQQGFQYGFASKENPHLTTFQNSNSQKNPGDYYNLNGECLGTLKGYTSQILTDSVLHYIDNRNQEKPFFIYLAYDAVHERIYNPDKYDAMYNTGDANRDVYYANITYLDAQIGRLMDGLQEMGLDENTIVFFTSDNGHEIMRAYYGAWRSYGTSYPLYGSKRTLYEGGIRVPGIIKWKGKIAHRISNEPNSTVDVMPTICELIGVDIPRERPIDGTSLVPFLLKGEKIVRNKPLYWQYDYPECYKMVGVGYNRRFDGQTNDPTMYRPIVSLRQGNHVIRGLNAGKFVEPTSFVLYDVVNDPMEKHELSTTNPQLLKDMKDLLLERYREVNAERKATYSRHLNSIEKKE